MPIFRKTSGVGVWEPVEDRFSERILRHMKAHGVECRRGTSGGGNQLRQPYLKAVVGEERHRDFPVVDHVHFFGYYIGNYPELDQEKIVQLCRLLNALGDS